MTIEAMVEPEKNGLATTVASKKRRRKPTARLVDRLERELADVNQALVTAREDRIAANRKEIKLFNELTQSKGDSAHLAKTSQSNFDKAQRNGDVAAVLACLVAETNAPIDAMIKLSETSQRMNVSSDIIKEIRVALKRGYDAQIDQVLDIVEAADKVPLPLTVNKDLKDDIEIILSGGGIFTTSY